MEKILEQYGRVTVYMEPNHPSPMYHVDGGVEPNPYGNLAVLLEVFSYTQEYLTHQQHEIS